MRDPSGTVARRLIQYERICERVDSLRLKDLLTSDNSIRSGFHLSYLGRELVVTDNARKCGISTVNPVRNY